MATVDNNSEKVAKNNITFALADRCGSPCRLFPTGRSSNTAELSWTVVIFPQPSCRFYFILLIL